MHKFIETACLNVMGSVLRKMYEKLSIQGVNSDFCLFFIWLMGDFVKKPILKKNKINIPANHIISLMNKMMREPVYLTVKYLYPKFYRIDDQRLFSQNQGSQAG